jgi:myosin V
VTDMTNLNYLHEAAILYNLRTRFFAANPYTYTGDICIAVNPYQWLDIYTETIRKEYYVMNRAELPPHAYATSSAAFNGIQEGGPNQSILVSGESGAGKTETVKTHEYHVCVCVCCCCCCCFSLSSLVCFCMSQVKILMAHVAFISAGDDQSVINRILKSNPLLESFGNAKTTRNDNSSRFGKFTELQFDKSCRLIGSVSRTYLLEKSRVVHQSAGERNFHIFHQLISAVSQYHPHLKVPDGDLSYVLEHSDAQLIEGKSDRERLGITCNALELVIHIHT